jgi:hypothetical protein
MYNQSIAVPQIGRNGEPFISSPVLMLAMSPK